MDRLRIPNFTRLFLFTLLLTPHTSVLAQDGATSETLGVEAASTSAADAEVPAARVNQDDTDVTILVGTKTVGHELPTGAYTTYTEKITFSAESDEETVTFTGSLPTTTIAGNATETDDGPAQPTNTQPCNNYVEFCERKYGNITFVGAHNSPFVREGSSAANQQLDVIHQLNDGIRFLQAQIQFPTDGNVPHFCHTSCDMLDAGPITDWLRRVREWVDDHPYDVVTIMLGNGNYSTPDLYAPYIEASGIVKYAYRPTVFPMSLDDWPTLSELIIKGKRVIMFMDYKANQKEYPWLLDQFSQMWESPFNPLDRSFPCVVQRPPNLGDEAARDRLYLLNHNLNVEFELFGASILVPAVSELNMTNGVEGPGSLGVSTGGCVEKWGRPPNTLLVDYYNFGDSPGSVFKVAAKYNNVTYNGECCGKFETAGGALLKPELLALVAAIGFAVLMS